MPCSALCFSVLRMSFRNIIHVLLVVSAGCENVIENGDFDTGELSPWTCPQSQCSLLDTNQLSVSDRNADWAGPRQFLNVSSFQQDALQYSLTFKLQTNLDARVQWILRTDVGGVQKWITLFSAENKAGEWMEREGLTTFPSDVVGADSLMIYAQIQPSEVDYIVDFVCLSEYSPSDEWEHDVEANIDSLRKRNISINFAGVDAKDLTLEITQTSHNYPFGHAVVSQEISDCETSGVDSAYCIHVKDNYNWIVDTYRMKWKPIEPNKGDFLTEIPDNMISWAKKHNLTVRGHSLLWAKQRNNPSWLWNLNGTEFEEAVYKHIDDTMDHFNTKDVVHWDVINEMVDQPAGHTFYMDQSGNPNIRVDIHKYVKNKYPNNVFYINDYGIIMDKNDRFAMFQQLLRGLIADGVQIDGIGLQSHISGTELLDFNLIKQRVQSLWQEFQLPLWITEFDWNGEGDIDWGDHSRHAEILTDFYRLMFSQESIHGIIAWRMTTFDENQGVPNKAGEAYKKLYHQDWNSSQTLQPAQSSSVEFRAFMGDFNIKIKRNSEVLHEFQFNLDEDKMVDCVNDSILNSLVCSA